MADVYSTAGPMLTKSMQVVQSRVEIMVTVIARIICDYKMDKPYGGTTTFNLIFKTWNTIYIVFVEMAILVDYWVYFYLLVICMTATWITPENRVISVE